MENKKTDFIGYFPQVALGGAMLIATSLTTSRALLSIGVAILALAALMSILKNGVPRRSRALILAGGISLLVVLPVLSFFWSDIPEEWAKDVIIKLPFLFLPFSLAILPAFSRKQLTPLFLVFVAIQAIVVLMSIFQNLFFVEAAAKGSPLHGAKIITGMNHIYFGTILGFASLLSMGWGFLYRKDISPWIWKSFILLGVFCAIGLHFLNSRTGMLSFYAGAGTLILGYIIRYRQYKLGLIAGILVILIPFSFYQLSDTMRTRVDDAFSEGLNYTESRKTGDFSTQPAGIRLLTWEACLSIIKQNPILGTSPGDMKNDLMAWYEQEKIPMKKTQLLTSAHNQFLESLTGLGPLGLLALLFAFIFPIAFPAHRPVSILLLALLAVCATAMLTESFLERQIGIAFFCFFLMVLYRVKPLE